MKRTVNRMVSIIISAIVIMSAFANVSASAMTYRTLTYTAGNVDNLVGATEVNFEKIVDTTFDTAASSRFSRKGYALKSWFVPSTGETVGTGAQYVMPNRNITFVANWEPVSYTVTFAGKGGKTESGLANVTSKATFGTEMVLPESEFTNDGFVFAGWKYSGTIYNAGESFEVPALLSGSKIVFAAVWEEAVEEEVEEEIAAEEEMVEEEVYEEEFVEDTEEEIVEDEIVEETTEDEFAEVEEETTEEELVEEVEEVEEEIFAEEELTEDVVYIENTEEAEEEIVEEEVEVEEEIFAENELTADVVYIENENVIGDYNNDGVVTAEDMEALRKFMVGVEVKGFEITAETADINGDGIVNVFDYMMLSRTIA